MLTEEAVPRFCSSHAEAALQLMINRSRMTAKTAFDYFPTPTLTRVSFVVTKKELMTTSGALTIAGIRS